MECSRRFRALLRLSPGWVPVERKITGEEPPAFQAERGPYFLWAVLIAGALFGAVVTALILRLLHPPLVTAYIPAVGTLIGLLGLGIGGRLNWLWFWLAAGLPSLVILLLRLKYWV